MAARIELRAGERIDDLIRDNLKIIQNPEYFCFSIDAVLLAHFATLAEGQRIMDLGTGTGVIPLLMTTRALGLQVRGLEIQPAVADMASRSVALNGLGEQVVIEVGDLRQVEGLFAPGGYDLVTANPPYQPVGRGRVNPNESKALARHELACNLADVVKAGAFLLKQGGRLAMVHRPERLPELLALLGAKGINPGRLRLVYTKKGQKACLILLEGVLAGKGELEILPPLIIYQDSGEYTEEIMDIYFNGG
ncbi:MAG: tRNA1(Val) (adenine(37)-N6)-methyltransferase [Clostridia bacterium]|nr:tRNA1(Val) (adenine(37)-N6)-methyltransferase [Clostridia bacterium]